MSLETRREKLIYLGLVPVIGAVCGAIATTLLTGPGASEANMDIVAILSDDRLTGPQKLQALEIYRSVANRPWDLLSNLFLLLGVLSGSLVWALADRIRQGRTR